MLGLLKRPTIFKVFSLIFAGMIISIPLQIMFLYGHSWSEMDMVFRKITFLNWAVMACCLANAILTFRVSRLLSQSLIISIFVVTSNNIVISAFSSDFNPLQVHLSSFLYLFGCLVLSMNPAFQTINEERRKWWKIPKRFRTTLPIWIKINDETSYLGKTFDLSRSGAFISYEGLEEIQGLLQKLPVALEQGSEISIVLGMKNHIKCSADIVRKSPPKGNYPGGLGLRFKHLGPIQSIKLNKFLIEENFVPRLGSSAA